MPRAREKSFPSDLTTLSRSRDNQVDFLHLPDELSMLGSCLYTFLQASFIRKIFYHLDIFLAENLSFTKTFFAELATSLKTKKSEARSERQHEKSLTLSRVSSAINHLVKETLKPNH